jgi:steroid 5-alpha reductase family enzyme
MSVIQTAFTALAACMLCSFFVWLVSLRRQNVAVADRAWPLLIMLSATVCALGAGQVGARVTVMLVLGGAWALRLCGYITWRSWGQPEDPRYVQIRQRNQPHFAWKSLYLVFALQAGLAWVVSMPFLAASLGPQAAAPWHGLDSLGCALALGGLLFEAVADAQMAAFKNQAPERVAGSGGSAIASASPGANASAGPAAVMSTGLWRYSRHPNYFGESCLWSGLFLLALSAGGWWAVVSPVLITYLLLKVSGINLQEQDLASRGPAYVDYVRRTSAFVPRRPKAP